MLPSSASSVTRFSGRQILGREPEVDRVTRHSIERPPGASFSLQRLLAAEHLRLRLPDHLDAPERELEVVAAEVEVVQARVFWKTVGFSSRESASTAMLSWNM